MGNKSNNETKTPGFDVEGYNAVVAKAELGFIRLTDLSFSVHGSFVPKADAQDQRSFDGKMSEFFYAKEEGYAVGTFKWQVKIKRDRKIAVKATATYEVLYTGVTDLEEENVRRYVHRIGRVGAYPYFRALMAHLDLESGTRLPPLPVLRG